MAKPSEKSVVGLFAKMTELPGGFDLVIDKADPPLLVKRSLTLDIVRP
jgi:hypothetical protein